MGFTYVVDGPALEMPGGGGGTGSGDAGEGPGTGEAQGGAAEDCTQAPASDQHHTLPHQTFLGKHKHWLYNLIYVNQWAYDSHLQQHKASFRIV